MPGVMVVLAPMYPSWLSWVILPATSNIDRFVAIPVSLVYAEARDAYYSHVDLRSKAGLRPVPQFGVSIAQLLGFPRE